MKICETSWNNRDKSVNNFAMDAGAMSEASETVNERERSGTVLDYVRAHQQPNEWANCEPTAAVLNGEIARGQAYKCLITAKKFHHLTISQCITHLNSVLDGRWIGARVHARTPNYCAPCFICFTLLARSCFINNNESKHTHCLANVRWNEPRLPSDQELERESRDLNQFQTKLMINSLPLALHFDTTFHCLSHIV